MSGPQIAAVHPPAPKPPAAVLRVLRGAALLCSLALLAAALTGCGRMQRTESAAPADGYRVTFAVEPAAPVVGRGVVVLTLADSAGQPIDNARIEIEGNMSHAGMKPEFGRADAGQGGRYSIPIEWTMGGAWYVDVKATLSNGQVITRRFPLNVGSKP